jgi:hypothetical protein
LNSFIGTLISNKAEAMDFRCKFVIIGDLAEISLFETIKEKIVTELSWDIDGIDRMEFEERDCGNEPEGLIRVPVIFKFHTNSYNEIEALFDVYTWVYGMINRYGRNFGIDEIAVNGLQVDVPEDFWVHQLIREL